MKAVEVKLTILFTEEFAKSEYWYSFLNSLSRLPVKCKSCGQERPGYLAHKFEGGEDVEVNDLRNLEVDYDEWLDGRMQL